VRLFRRNADGGELAVGVLRRAALLRIGERGPRRPGELDLGPLPPRSLLVLVADRMPRLGG
jgi:hypothetical protein